MSLKHQVSQVFQQRFGSAPALLVQAPGRVNLIGEHTDYNDGFVLPMAIDREVWIALRPRSDHLVRVHSLDFDQTVEFSLGQLENTNQGWAEYIKGVAWALQEAGYRLTGWEGVTAGNVPIGSGLSSSAALELAAARAFAVVSNIQWDPTEMALLSQKAENQWVGVNCGIMDQLISAAGQADHALLIDCRSLAIEPVPLPDSVRIVVLYSAAPRALADSAYNQRRSECESAVVKLQAVYPDITALRDVTSEMLAAEANRLTRIELRRARHVVSENERVLASVQAMSKNDVAQLGLLMVESHVSLREDYEVSSRELDLLVELALAQPGVLGARLTGAGFGGCAIALVEDARAGAVADAVVAPYRQQTGLPGEAYVTVPGDGAAIASPGTGRGLERSSYEAHRD